MSTSPGSSHRTLIRQWSWVRALVLTVKFRRPVRTVTAEAARRQPLSTPYADPGSALGLDGFVLGLEGVAHSAEAGALAGVLLASHAGHVAGLEAIAELMAPLAGGSDLDEAVRRSRSAVSAWSAALLGLHPPAAELLLPAAEAVVHRTYENPTFPGCPFDAEAGRAASLAVSVFRSAVRRQLADGLVPVGSVLAALMDRHGGDHRAVVRDIVGLAGGPALLTHQACAAVLDWAGDPSNRARLVQSAALGQVRFTHDIETFVSVVPPAAMLPRLLGGQRTMVMLWEEPAAGDVPLPAHPNPVFGVSPHLCLGRSHALEAVAAVLFPLFGPRVKGEPA